jgi:hypothetical protein
MMSLDQIFRDVYKDCVCLHIHSDKEILIELSNEPKEKVHNWIIKNASAEIKIENIVQFDIVVERVEVPFINVIYKP